MLSQVLSFIIKFIRNLEKKARYVINYSSTGTYGSMDTLSNFNLKSNSEVLKKLSKAEKKLSNSYFVFKIL